MLIKIILIQLLLLFVLSGYTQDANRYHKAIYAAETDLMQNNYKESVRQYQEAFKSEGVAFSADLINAFKGALMAGSRKDIKSLWKEARNDTYFAKWVKKDELLLSYIYPSLRKQVKAYVVPEIPKTRLEQVADSILNEDQALRHRCPNNLKNECIELFRERDSVHIFFLRNLLMTKSYTRKDFSRTVLFSLNIVALHARRFGHTTLDSLFIAYTKAGFIKPYLYAELNGYQTDLDEGSKRKLSALPKLGFGRGYLIVNDTALLFQQSDSLVAVYNKNRKELFMDDVQREMAKFRFAWSQPLFRNSLSDLGLANEKLRMSKQEEKEFINQFKSILIR